MDGLAQRALFLFACPTDIREAPRALLGRVGCMIKWFRDGLNDTQGNGGRRLRKLWQHRLQAFDRYAGRRAGDLGA